MLDSRRVIKILHEIGSSGMLGALLAHGALRGAATVSDPSAYAAVRHGIDLVARFVLVPSLAVVLMTGLVAIAIHPPFHDTGWVWIKALLGVSVFEATLGGIVSPAHRAAELSASLAIGEGDVAAIRAELAHEWVRLGILVFLIFVNVVLSVWRPKLTRRAPRAAPRPAADPPAAPKAEAIE